MRDYYFWYVKDNSRPEGHITAETHDEFYAKLGPWLKERDAVIDAVKQVYWQESGFIPPVPPAAQDKRDQFSVEEVAIAERIGLPKHSANWTVGTTDEGGEYMSPV